MNLNRVRMRVAQMPKPFVRRNQALHVPAPRSIRDQGTPRQHHLQNLQKLLRDVKVRLIAGMMKSDQDLVGQPPAIAGCTTRSRFAPGLVFILAHRRP